MPIDPEPTLERLAQAVADDTPVDWDVELTRTPGAASTLDNLRRLAALARASQAADDSTGEAPDAPVEEPRFRWGPLSALAPIGEGSFGEVWKAWDPSLQRAVALKLRRGATGGNDRRWLDEARRLARVRHPNVLTVHGADVHDGRAGLWTDLLQGATLETILRERGTFGAREAALVGVELCGALAAVHRAGLVHGDVKASNVMREGEAGSPDGSGRIVLMDFGSAHETAPAGTTGGAAFGTPLAVAPEVLAGGTPSVQGDVYALGVLLYRLVTGRYPIEAATVSELTAKAARGQRVALRTARPDLPAAFVEAVERALEHDPARRFADPAAFEAALVGSIAPRSPAGTRATATPRRARPLAFGALALVVLALAAGAAFWFGRERRAGAPDTAATAAGTGAGATTPGANGAPAAAPVPAAVVLPPPQVDVTFVRAEEGVREALADGDVVGPGDRIALELEADEAVHAYVVTADEQGEMFVLFPLRDRGATNPLAPSRRHRLPGREGAEDLDWVVTSAGGREHFLVLAARVPVPLLEDALSRLPAARAGEAVRYPSIPASALEGSRGVGGVAARPAAPAPEGAGGRRLLALLSTLQAPGNPPIWVRLIALENPGP